MTLTVAELIQAPVMAGAPLLAGRDGVNREITWTAVIEWQAVSFVHPGDLVLTTCIGLDEADVTQFLRELLASGAAAVCVSLLPTGPVTAVPAPVLADADRVGVPLLDLPWEVAFADVNRWVIDEVIRRRYAPDSFARALLGGEGMDGIAAALEVALDRPALIFDGRLQLAGHGPMAATRLGDADLAELRMQAARLTRGQALAAVAELDVEPCRVSDLLGLGPGTGLAVVARHDTLGYLYILDAGEPDLPGLELRALEQASVAVAMEGLRRRSAADERAREDFLWLLVTGAARATIRSGGPAAPRCWASSARPLSSRSRAPRRAWSGLPGTSATAPRAHRWSWCSASATVSLWRLSRSGPSVRVLCDS